MSEQYIGEIRMFAGNYAPEGWFFCDGTELQISQYDVLFALIGTTYGGDGVNTFALPDLRGRIPVHQGTGGYQLGQKGGVEKVTVSESELPSHTHPLQAASGGASSASPDGAMLAGSSAQVYRSASSMADMSPAAIGPTGGGQPHDNVQPYLCISFIIAYYGIYPSHS